MTRKQSSQSSLVGYLCRWACATTCLIAIVAVVFHFQPGWFESLPGVTPKTKPAEGRQNPTPAELIAELDGRLKKEHDRVAQIQESLQQVKSLRDSLEAQVESSEQAVARRRAELVRYADYINADEGVVLASGEFVSATALRSRAITRRNELAAVTEQLTRIKEFATRVGSTVAELEQLLSRRQRDIAELTGLRMGLADKVNLLAQLDSAANAEQSPESQSLASLRRSVEQMQDVIEVRLELIEDDSEIVVLSLVHTD